MFDGILSAIPLLLDPLVIGAMALGTFLGITVGALPGLTATMTIAVLIPLTFKMSPLVALGMVAGIYNGAMYGASIPAILIRIPGTPAGIATVFDGYPMTQQGQSRLALRVSLISSSLGSFVSAVSLLLFAPPLARFALKFGPAEYFWLAIFGLTCISVMLSDDKAKGLISVCFGLVLGFVGIDQITGEERFTFDSMHLVGGLDILVVLTGLYAIPPALELIGKSIRMSKLELSESEATKTFRWLSLIPTWARSSLIGVIVGAIPGTGGNIASIISWNEARRASRTPERFGKGAPEGVAAAECANNGDTAASLIPALTLGIPGNAVAAVILGALLVHGLRPGPQLFVDSVEITYGFMLEMLVTSVFLAFIGIIGARIFVNALRIPPYILCTLIISMTIIGIFGARNSISDVYIMLILGVIGYFMEHLAIPLAPAVLAVILGPMAEAELRRALLISGDDPMGLFENTISLVIIALIALVILGPLVGKHVKRLAGLWKPTASGS